MWLRALCMCAQVCVSWRTGVDSKHERIQLIRERHRKLILEPRRRMEYALLDDWNEEPVFDDDELAGRLVHVDRVSEE